MSEETALYRIWGEADLLLYIGISNDFGRRWTEHAKKQPWWGEKRRLAVDEWYASRPEAETAETAAIKAEGPKYNIVHAAKSPRKRGPRELPAAVAPAFVPVRIPRWEGAPEHPIDKWMLPGQSMAELSLSNPTKVESIISGLPEESRKFARFKVESWRRNYEACRLVEETLWDLYKFEQECVDRPEMIARIRKARAMAREFLEVPCPCCGGEPLAGMVCQECGTAGPPPWQAVSRRRGTPFPASEAGAA